MLNKLKNNAEGPFNSRTLNQVLPHAPSIINLKKVMVNANQERLTGGSQTSYSASRETITASSNTQTAQPSTPETKNDIERLGAKGAGIVKDGGLSGNTNRLVALYETKCKQQEQTASRNEAEQPQIESRKNTKLRS